MKKLNLKDIKNAMSRDEMRSVKGAGCGGGCEKHCWSYYCSGQGKRANCDGMFSGCCW